MMIMINRALRTVIIVVCVVLVLAALGIVAYEKLKAGRNTLPAQYFHAQTAPARLGIHTLDHVVIIVEENRPATAIIGDDEAPYINQLANTYARATHYYAVTNPSLPNYIALTSGTTDGFASDCNPPGGSCIANIANIGDRLGAAHKTWKEYAETMPQPCYPYNSGNYAVKHNPFMYYPDITGNASRCQAHVVPFSRFATDLSSAASLPDYSFITPNLCDDMHNCSIKTGDAWLKRHVPPILQSPAFTTQHSLLVIVWDEGNRFNNNVLAVFAGPAAKQQYVSNNYYSHYSLLKTIENNWQLPALTQNDKSAPAMTDMLR